MLFLWTKYEYTVEVFTQPKCKPDPPESCWPPETNSGIQWPFRGASPCPEHTDPYQKTQMPWSVCLALLRAIRGVTAGSPTPVLACCTSREQKPVSCTLCPLRGQAPLWPSGPKPQGQWHQGSALGSHRWCLSKHSKLRPEWPWLVSFMPKACDQAPTKLLHSLCTRKNIFMAKVLHSIYNSS